MIRNASKSLFFLFLLSFTSIGMKAQTTRLLRQPSLGDKHVAFVYGADIWLVGSEGGEAKRLTSTSAVESDPQISPDGKTIAFSSNRSGIYAVYTVPADGGMPQRLTWYPEDSYARGWSPDGKYILYATSRGTAPSSFNRLWTVPAGGGPSAMLPAPWAHKGGLSGDGKQLAIDRVTRWDSEWRHYRGGQNTPIQVLDLASLNEEEIPQQEQSMDLQPIWVKGKIYFLSDRDFIMNIWSYDPKSKAVNQVTSWKDIDIKWISGNENHIAYERHGDIHLLDLATGKDRKLNISVHGDFPWAETRSEDVTKSAASASLSPTGKRIILQSRGEIFTVPVENGEVRNITRSADAADRHPIWSPDGRQLAWFSDKGGKAYALQLSNQEGQLVKTIPIGISKMAWEPVWSPDSKWIAFVDDDLRIQVVELSTGKITLADMGGINIERGSMGLVWSPDSKHLAYAKTAPNNYRRITIWSMANGKAQPLSNPMADAFAPAWDRDGRHLYFLASTNVALGSGWANTSSMNANPTYGLYLSVLREADPTPFPLKSDEEPDSSLLRATAKDTTDAKAVKIDWSNIDQRILALQVPPSEFQGLISGPKGSVFIESRKGISKFSIDANKLSDFVQGASQATVSANGEKMLFFQNGKWSVVSTSKPPAAGEGAVSFSLNLQLDRLAEWKQIFTEAWRYQKNHFYDPNMHGRDWDEVWETYAPLLPFIRHRSDLTYLLDQLGGETSVGHSFVFGGDLPANAPNKVGVLGAELTIRSGAWQFEKILTAESWNPDLRAPLGEPGLNVKTGNYLLAINGVDLKVTDDPYAFLDGTADRQTVLTINNKPSKEGAWTIVVKPIGDESALLQRAWVENNRRKVEELSGGKLGYIWVPNTGTPGFVSFNRYYFAQQDKEGAVIDERFNGGGLLDDYMVDLMTRRLRAGLTNEVPGARPFQLPGGILGPKALLINELAGSGGDYFPWAFRQQKVGPLIGTRTWGGLVKSSVHYSFVDGGAMTAPDNAVYDPINHQWIAENKGVAPDIEVKNDAISVSKGRDAQLERAVQEVLKLLQKEPKHSLDHPPYSTPAKRK